LASRLSLLDAAFLYLETDEAPLHIGGVSVLDGDVTADAYAARLDARLPGIPRYLQRLAPAPLGLGHPLWEPDPAFDIRRHVLETRLDAPGDEAQLQACAARLFAPRLDRRRPLWEFHVIRGVAGGRTALLSKIHHAMVDGVSGVELMSVVFDVAPDAASMPARAAQLPPPTPVRGSGPADSLRQAVSDAVDGATALASGVAGLAGSWREVVDRAREASTALASAALHPVARLPFNRTLTGERRLGWLALPLDEIRAIGQPRRGTINDVALAVLADGIGRWLAHAGVPARSRFLRVLVPVNVRRDDERGQLGNRVSMVPVEIPFDGDPLARLDYAIARTVAIKQARIAELVGQVGALGNVLPAWLVARVLPLATSRTVLAWTAPLRSVPFLTANLVCTNVPGPPVPLYGLGRRLVAHYPLVPLGFETGLNCALLTYDGVLYVGLVADAVAIDDLAPLTRCLRSAYNDLRTSSGEEPGSRGAARRAVERSSGAKDRHAVPPPVASRPRRSSTTSRSRARRSAARRGE
jgi:WS/DGAT/MGAT family acyltransferase